MFRWLKRLFAAAPSEDRPVVLTRRAAREIHGVAVQQRVQEPYWLRIGIHEVSGKPTYYLDLTDEIDPAGKVTYPCEGLRVVVEAGQVPLLKGTVVEYHEDGQGQRGFVFDNPQSDGDGPPAIG